MPNREKERTMKGFVKLAFLSCFAMTASAQTQDSRYHFEVSGSLLYLQPGSGNLEYATLVSPLSGVSFNSSFGTSLARTLFTASLP